MSKQTTSSAVDEVIRVELHEMIYLCIEGLNDLAEKQIGKGILEDINYEVVGHEGNTIHLRVVAEVYDA